MGGWVLGRFIELDVPQAASRLCKRGGYAHCGLVRAEPRVRSSGESKPQYLVLGDRGSEGQDCDFTLMRVFTWGNQRQRYETAFVESDVCGKLPVKLVPGQRRAATPRSHLKI